ncbi:M-phase inducer phosphatase [Caenorhabditis elegans]|uniref:M-phase inducer phosphatase n=1 Tax=Caenorhabditis elegans TaxID=6239 RepID=Q21762_CAEEL|nr:M-phase inducer phosphatase [Caenorhabditis elegans]CAA88725.2 M-phase inducer phosphatase [Caenorhabditis elegans]|eukprot:NP_496197.2 Cell Division Cycle related [Caenorhabditis elegans]
MLKNVNNCLSKNDNLQGIRLDSRLSVEQIPREDTAVKTPVVRYCLPTVESPQRESSSFRSISATVFASLLRDRSRCLQLIIFDCRYPFEYFGGHIKGAVNIYSLDELGKYLYDEYGVKSTLGGLIPIFYCEYSQVRGPAMARRLRKIDTHRNNHRAAALDFPEIYLLDKGYVNFWSDVSLRDLCEPRYYISMHARPFRHALQQYTQHRSKSTANDTKHKKTHMRIFSSEHLLDEPKMIDVPSGYERPTGAEETSTPRQPRARTPRARLLFEPCFTEID